MARSPSPLADRQLHTYVPDAVADEVVAEATYDGMSVSTWLRHLVLGELRARQAERAGGAS